MTLHVSLFSSNDDNLPVGVDITWEQLRQQLANLRVSPCTIATCKLSECEHKNGGMWSPASWLAGARRAKHTVECIYFLVIDIDHVTDEELPSILERIAPFDHIVHASHSDRPGDRCLRVIIRLTRPVLGLEWPRFWRAAMTALGQPADEHTKDASRIYYLPSRPSDAVDPTWTDGTGYRFEFADGYPLDVDAVLALAPPEVHADLTIDDDYVVSEFAGAPSVERIVEASQVLGAAWPAAGADRHGAHLSLAGALARAGWPVELIADFAACVAEVQQPGNADLRKRLTAARSSVEKARSGQAVAGWPTLEDHLGEEPVTRAIELLGLRTGPQHDQDFVDQWAARATRGPSAPPGAGPQIPSGIDVDSALKATQKTLAKRKDPDSIRDAEYIKRAMRGVMLTDDASEDRARALAIAAVAIARSVPPNTTPEQVERVLLASAGNLASELPEAVAGALVVARSMPPITTRVPRVPAPVGAANMHYDVDQFAVDTTGPRQGKPSANSQQNFDLALRRLNIEFRYDEFARKKLLCRGDAAPKRVEDDDLLSIIFEVDRMFDFRPPKDSFFDYCRVRSKANAFHPVKDYYATLPEHDGEDHTSTWLIKFGGAEDTPYVRAVSRLILVASVRRVRHPGSKFDEIVVLEGIQGAGKSTGIEALCPKKEWFTDNLPFPADSKVVIEQTSGKLFVEAAELTGFSKSDLNKFKSFASRTTDESRLSYDKETTDRGRQFVMFATTNESEYLRDMTGDRRFWPVAIPGGFDVAGLQAVRDQIWAEACALEAAGEPTRLDPSLYAAATVEQLKRRIEEPYQVILEEILGESQGRLKLSDVWRVLGFHGERPPPTGESMKISSVLRAMGFKHKRESSGARAYYYVRGSADREIKISGTSSGGWHVVPELPVNGSAATTN